MPDRPTPPVEPPGTGALVCLGRLSPRKAPHVAVGATQLLVERGYDVTLELAGTAFEGYEWYVDELHEQVRAGGLGERVRFSGYVSPAFDAYDRSDVVLAPSLLDAFGNMVVEAQLSQRPVVATAVGGHTESVVDGETGLLVRAEAADAMADATAALLDDPERGHRIGETARRRALDRFGIERYRREVAAAVTSLLSR